MIVRDKVIVVSGIGPGLGVKLAIHAGREGARGVVLAARTPANLDDAEERVKAEGTGCGILKMQTDITDKKQCAALATATMQQFGRADALMNNAYSHPDFDLVETADLDRWHLPYDVNVIGTLKMSQAYIPHMKEQGGGSIVMINTKGTRAVPSISESAYCASKTALWAATRQLATEVGKHQIRVNSIHMGFMWGRSVENYMKTHPERFGSVEEGYKKVAEKHPIKRITTDDECARAALFLASDYATALCGATIDCNGGQVLP